MTEIIKTWHVHFSNANASYSILLKYALSYTMYVSVSKVQLFF